MKKLYEKKRADICNRVDRGLLRSAIRGQSAE